MAVSQAPDWSTLGGDDRDQGQLARGRRVGPHRHGRRLVRRRHADPRAGHDLHRPGTQGGRVHPRHSCAAASPRTRPSGPGSARTGSSWTGTRQGAGRAQGPLARGASGQADGRDGPGHHPGAGASRRRPAASAAASASAARTAGCTARATASRRSRNCKPGHYYDIDLARATAARSARRSAPAASSSCTEWGTRVDGPSPGGSCRCCSPRHAW